MLPTEIVEVLSSAAVNRKLDSPVSEKTHIVKTLAQTRFIAKALRFLLSMVKWSESACFALIPAVAKRVNTQQPKTMTAFIFLFLRKNHKVSPKIFQYKSRQALSSSLGQEKWNTSSMITRKAG